MCAYIGGAVEYGTRRQIWQIRLTSHPELMRGGLWFGTSVNDYIIIQWLITTSVPVCVCMCVCEDLGTSQSQLSTPCSYKTGSFSKQSCQVEHAFSSILLESVVVFSLPGISTWPLFVCWFRQLVQWTCSIFSCWHPRCAGCTGVVL